MSHVVNRNSVLFVTFGGGHFPLVILSYPNMLNLYMLFK